MSGMKKLITSILCLFVLVSHTTYTKAASVPYSKMTQTDFVIRADKRATNADIRAEKYSIVTLAAGAIQLLQSAETAVFGFIGIVYAIYQWWNLEDVPEDD